MAKLSNEDILKLAKLARLKLTDQEVEKYKNELSSILEYVELLDSVDTTGLLPTYQVTGLQNVSRADEIINYGISQDDLLKNLPNRQKDYVKVRRMI